jgi:hypothetical protein
MVSSPRPARRGAARVLFAAALLAASAILPAAAAVTVGGVRFDDTIQLAGKELKLNGAGVRTKVVFKVYAVGLYLPEKASTAPDVLGQDGPRRVRIVMLRDVPADTFANAFFEGLTANTTKAEQSRLAPQMRDFNAVFTAGESLKKGDVVQLDWLPTAGTQCSLNGKKLGDPLPDVAFYNAVLRIWLGDHPVDDSLKPAMLGAAR